MFSFTVSSRKRVKIINEEQQLKMMDIDSKVLDTTMTEDSTTEAEKVDNSFSLFDSATTELQGKYVASPAALITDAC